MGCCDYLKNLLRPMRLYDVDEGYGADELWVEGSFLDGVLAALDDIDREMLIPTAEDTGLARYEELLPYRPSSATLAERRQAVMALLRVDDCSFTPEALNSTLSGCGITAAVEETDTRQRVRVQFPGSRGTPPGFGELKRRIEQLLPCHLEVEYYMVFPMWTELEAWFPSWSAFEGAALTWEELERYGG